MIFSIMVVLFPKKVWSCLWNSAPFDACSRSPLSLKTATIGSPRDALTAS